MRLFLIYNSITMTNPNLLLINQAMDMGDYDYAEELLHPTQTLSDKLEELRVLSGQGVDVSQEAIRLSLSLEEKALASENPDQELLSNIAVLTALIGDDV